MAHSEVKLRNLKPKEKAYQESDGEGIFVEVLPSGGKVWRLRYRLASTSLDRNMKFGRLKGLCLVLGKDES